MSLRVQRGQEFYTQTGKYTVDRWCQRGTGTTTPNQNGSITLKTSTTGQLYGVIQPVEKYENLLGKTVTLSVKLSNINVASNTTFYMALSFAGSSSAVGNEIASKRISNITSGIYTLTATIPSTPSSTLLNICLVFPLDNSTSNDTITIDYAKLEIGNIATAYSPRTYAEELNLCQRYYYTTGNNYSKAMMLKATSTWNFSQDYLFMPNQMREIKTITVYGGANAYVNSLPTRNDDNTRISVTTDVALGNGNGFLIYATSGDAVVNTQYRLNGYTVDAEL